MVVQGVPAAVAIIVICLGQESAPDKYVIYSGH